MRRRGHCGAGRHSSCRTNLQDSSSRSEHRENVLIVAWHRQALFDSTNIGSWDAVRIVVERKKPDRDVETKNERVHVAHVSTQCLGPDWLQVTKHLYPLGVLNHRSRARNRHRMPPLILESSKLASTFLDYMRCTSNLISLYFIRSYIHRFNI